MKDLGKADVILGIKITRHNDSLVLSQSHCIEKVLRKFHNYDWKPIHTPFDMNMRLEKNEGNPEAQLEYSRAIGCLMYVMTCTRLDITFAVRKLSRYTCNPGCTHWHAVRRILKLP